MRKKSIYIESSIFGPLTSRPNSALETWGRRPLSDEELQAILKQLDELPDDWDNPFVDEVRAVRQRHAARFDNDLDRICEDIRRNSVDNQ